MWAPVISVVRGGRMNMEDSRLIAQFQRLTTELLIEKRLGRRRPELTDELYRTWLEVDQRDLKETPEYRNVMKRADRHALWLAGLVMLSNSDAAAPSLQKKQSPSSRMRRPTGREGSYRSHNQNCHPERRRTGSQEQPQ